MLFKKSLKHFISQDIPDYYTTWSALVTTLLTLLIPEPLITPTALTLAAAFGVEEESVLFLEKYYIPKVKQVFRKRTLPVLRKIALFKSTLQMAIKMIFAFKYQENTFDIDFLTSPLGNQV